MFHVCVLKTALKIIFRADWLYNAALLPVNISFIFTRYGIYQICPRFLSASG